MADNRNGIAEPPDRKHEPNNGADRKHLGENGLPQKMPTPEQQDAANRTQTTVRHSLKRGLQETELGTGEG